MKVPLSPALRTHWWKLALAVTPLLVLGTPAPTAPNPPRAAAPDLSGLAWIRDDSFLAVHDAKGPGQPRVSVVMEPGSPAGPLVRTLRVKGLKDEPFDLESIARIPPKPGAPPEATPSFLLAESGSNERYRRIFMASYEEGDEITLKYLADLPSFPWRADVEGIALRWGGNRLWLVFADRAEGDRSTMLRWASLSLEGPQQEPLEGAMPFSVSEPDGPRARQISALEFDSSGYLYAASTQDPGVDVGPFRSHVWRVGWARSKGESFEIQLERQGGKTSALQIATVDGFKVESLAIRELKPGIRELFIGTDDEAYGGIMRTLGVLPK